MSQKTLPWPLFVNQGFYIPKCLLSCVDFKNGSCHFFFSLLRSRSKVKGHGFRIHGITYIMSLFLSHLRLARCDIGVQLSVRPFVRPSTICVESRKFTSSLGINFISLQQW